VRIRIVVLKVPIGAFDCDFLPVRLAAPQKVRPFLWKITGRAPKGAAFFMQIMGVDAFWGMIWP
jgi:hypothetical protein